MIQSQLVRYLCLGIVMTSLFGLSACSRLFGDEGQFRDRTLNYRDAGSEPELQYPEGVPAKPFEPLLVIPDLQSHPEAYTPADSKDVPKPRALLSVSDSGHAVHSSGDQYWLQVKADAQAAKNRLVEFLEVNNLGYEQSEVDTWIIYSDWLKPRNEDRGFFSWGSRGDQLREKFRFEVKGPVLGGRSIEGSEPGLLVSEVKIELSHLRRQAVADVALAHGDDASWSDASTNDELLRGLLDEMLAHFQSVDDRLTGSPLLARRLGGVPRVALEVDGNDYPVLFLGLDFNRAWERVGAALSDSDIEVLDLDRSLALYFLRLPSTGGDMLEYELKLSRAETGVHVALQLDDNTLAPKALSSSILNSIKERL